MTTSDVDEEKEEEVRELLDRITDRADGLADRMVPVLLGKEEAVVLPKERWDHVIHSLEENIDQLHGGPDDEPLHEDIEPLQETLERIMEQVVEG